MKIVNAFSVQKFRSFVVALLKSFLGGSRRRGSRRHFSLNKFCSCDWVIDFSRIEKFTACSIFEQKVHNSNEWNNDSREQEWITAKVHISNEWEWLSRTENKLVSSNFFKIFFSKIFLALTITIGEFLVHSLCIFIKCRGELLHTLCIFMGSGELLRTDSLYFYIE